jgi:cysteine synthase A
MSITEAVHLRVAENITELVGETPMLHLRRIALPGSADIYAKLEYLNPGGALRSG